MPCAPGRAAQPDRVARIVRTAVRAYDERRYAAVHARLPAETRARLDALLQAGSPETADAAGAETDPETQAAALIHLRSGPGRASVASLRDELARLDLVRRLELPDGLFADWSPAELEACRQRVAVEAPYELRRHPERNSRTCRLPCRRARPRRPSADQVRSGWRRPAPAPAVS